MSEEMKNFLMYTTPNGEVRVQVLIQDETIWLTQKALGELFGTTLDESFLRRIKTKASQYIIYADNCLLSKEFMQKYNIIFKKIPRDITRF